VSDSRILLNIVRFTHIKEHQTGHVIEMSLYFFDGKVRFITKLACWLFGILFFLAITAAITVVYVHFWYLIESIAGQMEAGVTGVAVEYLIGVIVIAAKTYFTVSLKYFFAG
jgi:hypothetical protein